MVVVVVVVVVAAAVGLGFRFAEAEAEAVRSSRISRISPEMQFLASGYSIASLTCPKTCLSPLEDVEPVHQLDMCGESRLSQGLDDGLARRVSHRLVILGCVCDWTDEDVRVLTGGVCDTPIIPHRMGMGLSLGL
uniref:Uncharacterized protein n=1 Tax=Ananas comosus var. bracteatus TaxID=296719 RepID=A0A6V7Q9D5_ANACO|nr:unnamed protein product [Ananas comosus var. bracteatus]